MRVAVLGLGAMSTPIAERLEQAGSLRAVWNRSAAPAEPFAARGVLVLPRPADALAQADVAVTMLADDAAVKTVTLGDDGVLPDAGGGVLIDMSTISARASAEIAERCREAGGRLPAGPRSPATRRSWSLGTWGSSSPAPRTSSNDCRGCCARSDRTCSTWGRPSRRGS